MSWSYFSWVFERTRRQNPIKSGKVDKLSLIYAVWSLKGLQNLESTGWSLVQQHDMISLTPHIETPTQDATWRLKSVEKHTQISPCLVLCRDWMLAWIESAPSPIFCRRPRECPWGVEDANLCRRSRLHAKKTRGHSFPTLISLQASVQQDQAPINIGTSKHAGPSYCTGKRQAWIVTAFMQRQTFNLVEFCQVSTINGLIAKDPVYTEVFCWLEAILSQPVQHPGGYCSGVSPQQILLSFALLPWAAISVHGVIQRGKSKLPIAEHAPYV